ncbi:serine/threonine-protein kinase [Sphaerimonospora mesophila]|uniref:serine/threonine-protein kinase n=1 Tax=Sphaerimonospora mesophila TaxID=37483 RepID=UPI0006E37198
MPSESVAGRYELTEGISSGAMGTVWRGYDAILDREVAVKVIRTDVISSVRDAQELADRFRREARITARIRHHGVPQVYDAVLTEPFDQLYLVMEHIHGTSLRAYIRPSALLPVPWAAAIAAQIATVLSHAHAVPVVHRDLKPDNVLVTADGTVKVLDFGIAAILRPDVPRLTRLGIPMGTSRYMSPEQTRASQVTPQSDLYALGCLLYELLSGRSVFDGPTEELFWEQHRHAQPQPLRELRPDVPEDLEKLVLQLLAKKPEQRPGDAYAVYEGLLPFLPPPGATAPQGGPELAGCPDPTHMYRRPNAPRPPDVPASTPSPRPAPRPGATLDTRLRAAIADVERQVNALLGEERYIQAADALEVVIDSVSATLGARHPRVLALRKKRAAVLFIGGDYRRSLPEFDDLANAYESAEGPASNNVIHCRRQAADCRAELGYVTVALREYHDVLDLIRDKESDTSETAREIRRSIGALLAAEGDNQQSREVLTTLLEDLLLLFGPDHLETQEVQEMLRHLDGDDDAAGPMGGPPSR